MIESEQLPGGMAGSHDTKEPIILQTDNLAVHAVVKLLRTIAIDGFRYVCTLTLPLPTAVPYRHHHPFVG